MTFWTKWHVWGPGDEALSHGAILAIFLGKKLPFKWHFERFWRFELDDMYGGLGANFLHFFLEKTAILTPFGKHFEHFLEELENMLNL